MELSVGAWTAVLLSILVGATIQGAIGFGMNLVTVPIIVLVHPEALPVAAIVFGVPISLTMLRHERASLDRTGLVWLLGGRVPGSAVGAAIVGVASTAGLQVLIGTVILLIVVVSTVAPPVPLNRGTQAGAGFVSGITSTTAAIGGPPVALLYQRQAGPVIRATAAATFAVGTVLSLGALAIGGSVGRDGLVLGAIGMPVVWAGTVLGRRFHALLEHGWMRPAVLVFSATSALVVLGDALLW